MWNIMYGPSSINKSGRVWQVMYGSSPEFATTDLDIAAEYRLYRLSVDGDSLATFAIEEHGLNNAERVVCGLEPIENNPNDDDSTAEEEDCEGFCGLCCAPVTYKKSDTCILCEGCGEEIGIGLVLQSLDVNTRIDMGEFDHTNEWDGSMGYDISRGTSEYLSY